MGADVELSSVARLRVLGADFARQVDIIRRFVVDISDSVIDYQFVMCRKHLRIWQVSTFFGADKPADVGGWRVCGLPSVDVRRVLRIVRLGGCGRLRCDLQTRRVVGGGLAGASYGGQSASSSQIRRRWTVGVRTRWTAGVRVVGCTAWVRPTPTGSVDAVVCVVDGLVCGVVRPSASPPTGGRGGLRENCRTLVSYAFRRAKFFYKRRVRRVKEMLRIWALQKKKNIPPRPHTPPPADARKLAQEAA